MRGSSARALVPALVVLGLLAVVAIASTGSTTSGTSAVRPPHDVILDTILSLGIVALLPAAAILVYGLMQRKEIAREIASGRYRRSGLASFAFLMAVFLAVTYFRLRNWERPPQEEVEQPVVPPGTPVNPRGDLGAETDYEPRFAWIPVIVVVGLVIASALAYTLASRRKAAAHPTPRLAETLADTLDDTLDDLRAETDPRRAVIAAYARLERVLAADGVPRMQAETQDEYLVRFLRSLEVSEEAATRLTRLFDRAKYSRHGVDIEMKGEAIDALEQLRDELRSVHGAEVEMAVAGTLSAGGAA